MAVGDDQISELIAIIERGDLAGLEALLKLNLNPDQVVDYYSDKSAWEGEFPIISLALRFGHISLAECLKKAGASLESIFEELEMLVHRGEFNSLEWALNNDVPLTVKGKRSNVLVDAVSFEEEAMVRLLLSHGVPPDFGQFKKPCDYAAENGSIDMLKILFEYGESIHSMTPTNQTLLHSAAHYGRSDMVRYLASLGLDPNAVDRNGHTPLTLLILMNDSVETLQALLDAGADLSGASATGCSDLVGMAIEHKRHAIASFLESLNLMEAIPAIQPINAGKPRVRI